MPGSRGQRRPHNAKRTTWLLVVGLVVNLSVGIASADFVYPDFSSTQGLNLEGSAAQSGSALRLTPAALAQSGAAWRADQQSVAGGFTTQFSFDINHKNGNGQYGADGLAFVIQTQSATALGGNGDDRGYVGIPGNVAVYFGNYGFGGFYGIGITSDGNYPTSFPSINETNGLANFTNGSVHVAQIEYQSGTLSVFLDNLATPVLTTNLDLGSLLSLNQGSAWVGLTAGTGSDYQNNDALSWSFQSAPADIGSTSAPLPSSISCGGLLLALVGLTVARRRFAQTKKRGHH